MSARLRRYLRVRWCGFRGHDWREFGRWSEAWSIGHEHVCMACHTTSGVIWDAPERYRDDHCPVCRPEKENDR